MKGPESFRSGESLDGAGFGELNYGHNLTRVWSKKNEKIVSRILLIQVTIKRAGNLQHSSAMKQERADDEE